MRRKQTYLAAHAMALLFSTAVAIAPTTARADDTGFFMGLDAGGAFRFGSSHTTHAGAGFAGGATVHDVDFDTAYQLGGNAGYRFSPNLAVSVSYNYIAGDVAWRASFAAGVADSHFNGDAVSHVVLANVTYTPWTSQTTALDMTVGIGASVNQLQSVDETTSGERFHISDGTKLSPAARAGIGIRQKVADWLELGANAAVTYYGGYHTSDERTGVIPGRQSIGRYGLDPVWGASVGGSLRMVF